MEPDEAPVEASSAEQRAVSTSPRVLSQSGEGSAGVPEHAASQDAEADVQRGLLAPERSRAAASAWESTREQELPRSARVGGALPPEQSVSASEQVHRPSPGGAAGAPTDTHHPQGAPVAARPVVAQHQEVDGGIPGGLGSEGSRAVLTTSTPEPATRPAEPTAPGDLPGAIAETNSRDERGVPATLERTAEPTVPGWVAFPIPPGSGSAAAPARPAAVTGSSAQTEPLGWQAQEVVAKGQGPGAEEKAAQGAPAGQSEVDARSAAAGETGGGMGPPLPPSNDPRAAEAGDGEEEGPHEHSEDASGPVVPREQAGGVDDVGESRQEEVPSTPRAVRAGQPADGEGIAVESGALAAPEGVVAELSNHEEPGHEIGAAGDVQHVATPGEDAGAARVQLAQRLLTEKFGLRADATLEEIYAAAAEHEARGVQLVEKHELWLDPPLELEPNERNRDPLPEDLKAHVPGAHEYLSHTARDREKEQLRVLELRDHPERRIRPDVERLKDIVPFREMRVHPHCSVARDEAVPGSDLDGCLVIADEPVPHEIQREFVEELRRQGFSASTEAETIELQDMVDALRPPTPKGSEFVTVTPEYVDLVRQMLRAEGEVVLFGTRAEVLEYCRQDPTARESSIYLAGKAIRG